MIRKLVLLLLTVSQYTLLQSASLDIQLPDGPIRGRQSSTVNGNTYYAFEKIPYAAPPVGELRFQAPVPPSKWEETLNTLRLDVTCFETGANTAQETEDCLYINVFTPSLPSNDTMPNLPVLFYIHGGGFIGGSSVWIYSDYIIDEGVVLVAINYRLGPFGFLSTEDEVIPGNAGLKDQQLALKWAQENIALFGGDPAKITIFGNSAGSASCAYHLLNQNSRDLFRGAILWSGTSLSPWAYQRHARDIAFITAGYIDESFASSNDSTALRDFLVSVDAELLDSAAEQYASDEEGPADTQILQGFYWAPVIEVKNPTAFITKKMYELLQAGNTIQVPILIGMTSEEGLAFQSQEIVEANMAAYDEHADWLVPFDMRVEDVADRADIGELIKELYTGGEPLVDHLGDGIRYYSDQAFTRSVIKHAELYSIFADTFFYQFSYEGTIGPEYTHYDGAEGVGHSVDYSYVFCYGSDCSLSRWPEADALTVLRFNRIFTNFAKYLNPTPQAEELLQNITWPVVSTENGDFFYVDINENLEIKNHPKQNTYGKWNEIYDALGYADFDTY